MKRILVCVGLLVLVVACAASAADVVDVRAKNGMVSSAHELASKAGVEILEKGGNAVDAAIATQLALNVVEPNASGIGGGGFMTIRNAKTNEVVVLDYREIAPQSATKDMFASEASKKAKESELGGKAVGVPGAVKGMFAALRKYGTMSFAQVAEPALRLAEEGFEVHPMQQQIITDEFEKLSKYSPTCVFIVDGLPAQKGTMSALRRVAAGVYTEADAHTLEEIQAAKNEGPAALEALMLPVESVFGSLPLLTVAPKVEQHLYNGCPTSRYPAADGRYRVRNEAGQFLGLANIVGGVLKVEKLFVERN